MTDGNITQFPVAPRREAITQGKTIAPKYGTRRARVIRDMVLVASSQPEGTRVEHGKNTRAAINRVGKWLEDFDCLRAEMTEEDDKLLALQMAVVEQALAGLYFMHKPPTQKRPA